MRDSRPARPQTPALPRWVRSCPGEGSLAVRRHGRADLRLPAPSRALPRATARRYGRTLVAIPFSTPDDRRVYAAQATRDMAALGCRGWCGTGRGNPVLRTGAATAGRAGDRGSRAHRLGRVAGGVPAFTLGSGGRRARGSRGRPGRLLAPRLHVLPAAALVARPAGPTGYLGRYLGRRGCGCLRTRSQ